MTMTTPNALITELQSHLMSSQEGRLLFSYDLDHSLGSQETTLILRQKETDFSLVMTIKEQEEQRLVTKFTLIDNEQLGSLSLGLYDAGSTEIVFQALDLLFIFADQEDAEEILFILKKEDAEHLSSLESFFEDPIHASNFTSFILPTSTQDYDAFVEKTENLKTKIANKLWCRQREDSLLKSYMQRLVQDQPFNLNVSPAAKMPVILPTNNVIAFPTPKSPIKLKTIIKRKKNHGQ